MRAALCRARPLPTDRARWMQALLAPQSLSFLGLGQKRKEKVPPCALPRGVPHARGQVSCLCPSLLAGVLLLGVLLGKTLGGSGWLLMRESPGLLITQAHLDAGASGGVEPLHECVCMCVVIDCRVPDLSACMRCLCSVPDSRCTHVLKQRACPAHSLDCSLQHGCLIAAVGLSAGAVAASLWHARPCTPEGLGLGWCGWPSLGCGISPLQ